MPGSDALVLAPLDRVLVQALADAPRGLRPRDLVSTAMTYGVSPTTVACRVSVALTRLAAHGLVLRYGVRGCVLRWITKFAVLTPAGWRVHETTPRVTAPLPPLWVSPQRRQQLADQRRRQSALQVGDAHPGAKLSADVVRFLRTLPGPDRELDAVLGRYFKVRPQYIAAVRAGQTRSWRSVP